MRTIEFSLIILVSAFSSGCVIQIPAQPKSEYTVIVIPAPASTSDSRSDDQGSDDVNPGDQLKHEFRTTSGNSSEPQLQPLELSTDR